MLYIITSTKGYKNHTLEPLTKKLNKQVYSLQKQCNVLSTVSGLALVLTPALDIGTVNSGSNLVHSPPSHILCLTPCVKARKSFHGVLPCLVMMYHETNLDCKGFSISVRSSRNDCGYDLEHCKMIFLNDTLADDASPY